MLLILLLIKVILVAGYHSSQKLQVELVSIAATTFCQRDVLRPRACVVECSAAERIV